MHPASLNWLLISRKVMNSGNVSVETCGIAISGNSDGKNESTSATKFLGFLDAILPEDKLKMVSQLSK